MAALEPEFTPLVESLPLPRGALPVVLEPAGALPEVALCALPIPVVVDFFAGFFLLVDVVVEPDIVPAVPEADKPELIEPDCVPLLGVICPLPDCAWALAAAAVAVIARKSAAA